METKMKVVQTETLVKTKFADFKATEYLDNNDKQKFWTWVQRPEGFKAVMIVPYIDYGYKDTGKGYDHDIRLVVTKEYRITLGVDDGNFYEWGFPAGLIDKDETVEEAVKRELKEETGLDLKRVIRVSPFAYNTPGITDETIAVCYVEAEGDICNDLHEASEDIQTFVVDKDYVRTLLSDETKKFGSKAWIVLDQFVNGSPF
jgi:ADP-ribose pyrophosphatase